MNGHIYTTGMCSERERTIFHVCAVFAHTSRDTTCCLSALSDVGSSTVSIGDVGVLVHLVHGVGDNVGQCSAYDFLHARLASAQALSATHTFFWKGTLTVPCPIYRVTSVHLFLHRWILHDTEHGRRAGAAERGANVSCGTVGAVVDNSNFG